MYLAKDFSEIALERKIVFEQATRIFFLSIPL
jgi:hypothetical protein